MFGSLFQLLSFTFIYFSLLLLWSCNFLLSLKLLYINQIKPETISTVSEMYISHKYKNSGPVLGNPKGL